MILSSHRIGLLVVVPLIEVPKGLLCLVLGRGKVMSQEANKLQMPFSANSIYSRDPISKMSINCRSPFCASNKSTSLDINYTQSEINDSNMWKSVFLTSHIY